MRDNFCYTIYHTQMSGIRIHDDAVKKFIEQKDKKQIAAIIYALNEEKTHFVVEETLPAGTSLNDIVAKLPQKDCRYITYDYTFEKDGCHITKLMFI